MNILDYDNIVWQGKDDDYRFTLGQYLLRVEKMDKKVWWWCVYYLDEQIYYGHIEHKRTAMIKAEMNAKIHYLYHLIINK